MICRDEPSRATLGNERAPKHSPAPWVVEGPSEGNSNMGLWRVEGATNNVANHCTRADALLIAAAPDLLKCARNMLYAIAAASDPEARDLFARKISATIAATEAAIAKADPAQ